MKIYLYPYYEGADLKSDTRFQKFWAQKSKFKLFGPKGINFFTFEQKSQNTEKMGRNQSTHLG